MDWIKLINGITNKKHLLPTMAMTIMLPIGRTTHSQTVGNKLKKENLLPIW